MLTLFQQHFAGVVGIGQIGQGISVVLAGQLIRLGVVRIVIRPVQMPDRLMEGTALSLVEFAQPQEQVGHDLDVGLRLAGRFRALPVPLQPARTVDQRTILLGKTGGRQTEDFGLDIGRVHVVVLAVVLPELRGFGGQRVHDHHELEFGHAATDLVLVWVGCQRVEALTDEAIHLALGHQVEQPQAVVRLVQFR